LIVMDSETLVRKALALAPAERAELAHELLLSLDGLSELEVRTAWLDEAERRAQQLGDGTVSPVSTDEVRRDAHALLL
jgi:putative addiction module component (TIGR02574 family)